MHSCTKDLLIIAYCNDLSSSSHHRWRPWLLAASPHYQLHLICYRASRASRASTNSPGTIKDFTTPPFTEINRNSQSESVTRSQPLFIYVQLRLQSWELPICCNSIILHQILKCRSNALQKPLHLVTTESSSRSIHQIHSV